MNQNKYNTMKTKQHAFIDSITHRLINQIVKEDVNIIPDLDFTTRTKSSRYVLFDNYGKQFLVRVSTHKQKIPSNNYNIEFIIHNKREEVNIPQFTRQVLIMMHKDRII